MHNFQKVENQWARVSGANVILRNGQKSSNSRVSGRVTAMGFDIRLQAKQQTTHANLFQDGRRAYHA